MPAMCRALRGPNENHGTISSKKWFPTVAVPNLANVHDRHVHRPENREEDGVGVASENNKRQTKTEPCKDRQRVVGDSEPKKRRNSQHTGHVRTKLRMD